MGGYRRATIVSACALVFAAATCDLKLTAVPPPQKEPPVPKELLERVAFWSEQYLAAQVNYAAEETLKQTVFSSKGRSGSGQRTIVSQYVSARFGESARDQGEFRDVISVDGKTIQDDGKLAAKWPKLAAAQSAQQIAALVEDPIKYRLSPERFTGLARLPLRFSERNWGKMKFFFAQDTSDPPSPHVLIAYRQVAGDGMMMVDDKPVLPSGQAWIEPDDGHIVRIEEEFGWKDERYYTSVEFDKAEALGSWVPQAVIVRFFEKGRLVLENSYTYTAFRVLHSEHSAGGSATPKQE